MVGTVAWDVFPTLARRGRGGSAERGASPMAPRDSIPAVGAAMNARAFGEVVVVERLLPGLLADGQVLVDGPPDLAKTGAVKAMARHLAADVSRIRFSLDLLPSGMTGTDVSFAEGGRGAVRFQCGPVFGNILPAEEIDRVPAKVEAALLEPMEERQVTVGQITHPLPDVFLVMAAQRPAMFGRSRRTCSGASP